MPREAQRLGGSVDQMRRVKDSFPGGRWRPQVAGGGKMARDNARAKVQMGAREGARDSRTGGPEGTWAGKRQR